MKNFRFVFFIGLISCHLTGFAIASDYDVELATNTRTQPGYFENMGNAWARGFTNIVSSPLEIPITINNYHKEKRYGLPVIRHSAGLFDGIIRTVNRCGSGMGDILASFFPGDQQLVPVDHETLF